jgi:hypothetical protein
VRAVTEVAACGGGSGTRCCGWTLLVSSAVSVFSTAGQFGAGVARASADRGYRRGAAQESVGCSNL